MLSRKDLYDYFKPYVELRTKEYRSALCPIPEDKEVVEFATASPLDSSSEPVSVGISLMAPFYQAKKPQNNVEPIVNKPE
ncbi:MAG: hypothetical protein K0S29_192 [Gammaproteobacteria bacterium]|nr:hypothetical protein [Gammaproteobacteria bacterium]